MDRAVIVVVDDKPDGLEIVDHELRKRYGSDYEVRCARSGRDGVQLLRDTSAAGDDVCLVFAAHDLADLDSAGFFHKARLIVPRAVRVMLTEHDDRHSVETMVTGAAFGEIDHRLVKPLGTVPDEQFHNRVSDYLYQWARVNRRGLELVKIVGRRWSQRAHELRDAMARNSVGYGFYDVDGDEGHALLVEAGIDPSLDVPVVIVRDGAVIIDPSNRDVAAALGFVAPTPQRVLDLLVIGAGPAGLGAAVYGASEGLDTLILEREALGGQAGQAALVSNYMGFPGGISGQELAARACEQALLFGARFLATHDTVTIRDEDGVNAVDLDDGSTVRARAVIVATGADYRRLGVPAIEELRGAGVFYGSVSSEARSVDGLDVAIVGAGNSAGQSALHLAKFARSVTLVSRRATLEDSMSAYLISRVQGTPNVHVLLDRQVVDGDGDGVLTQITVQESLSGRTERLPVRALFVMIGAVPQTDWLPPELARDDGG
ncbi:MAG TPA: FAD-dependent oxidoreductase, partial [Thermoleophilia bacterium]|nr:FAD-dependent oxidoreductase [Thermoleophilia bacterium]